LGQVKGQCEVVEDGFIYMPGGGTIYQYSMEGIAIAEVLSAITNGEDGETAAARITAEIENMFGDDHRKITRDAMDEWTNKTGRVRFEEYQSSAWNTFLVVIALQNVIDINTKNLSAGTNGNATVGSWLWGISTMNLQNKDFNEDEKKRVPLHELGHVLGLNHEHQRQNRDLCVDVTKSGLIDLDNMKLPEISVTLWYPVIVTYSSYTYENFVKTGEFDFSSIMLYPGLPIKQAQHQNSVYGVQYWSTGLWVTKITTGLSVDDINIIKRIYLKN